MFSAFDSSRYYKEPVVGTAGSAGYDLFSSEDGQAVSFNTGVVRVTTNTRVAVPQGHVGLILGKSGLAVKGLVVLGGVIDSDYEGEIGVIVGVIGDSVFVFDAGVKVAQLIVVPIVQGVGVGSVGLVRLETRELNIQNLRERMKWRKKL